MLFSRSRFPLPYPPNSTNPLESHTTRLCLLSSRNIGNGNGNGQIQPFFSSSSPKGNEEKNKKNVDVGVEVEWRSQRPYDDDGGGSGAGEKWFPTPPDHLHKFGTFEMRNMNSRIEQRYKSIHSKIFSNRYFQKRKWL